MTNKVSENFFNAFHSGSGGIMRECGCGRVHFADYYNVVNDYDEGELDKLLEKEKLNPDKYISHNYSSIDSYIINNNELVMGCPCETEAKYEEFIINNRKAIARYLNNYASRLEDEAKKIRIYE